MRPIERKHRAQMAEILAVLTEIFTGHGVTLIVFELDRPDAPHRPGRINYVSNAQRASMISSLKDFIARHEAATPDEPHRTQ